MMEDTGETGAIVAHGQRVLARNAVMIDSEGPLQHSFGAA